jgi:hypothetical protein
MDASHGCRNLAFRATPKIIEDIDHVAKAEGLSASAIIRRAVLRDLPRLIRDLRQHEAA